MRTFGAMFVGGVASIILLKLLAALFLPLLGIFLGVVALALKLALVAAVIYFILAMVKRMNRRREESA